VPALGSQVSILLPTFNRAPFLEEAFRAIVGQTLANWELIVVDDGSTDESEAVVQRLAAGLSQRVVYVKQANAGAYGARNAALDLATAPLVAFYDSDDVWLPQHLADCVRALDENPDVAWVYAACKIVNYRTRALLDPDTFLFNGKPRPFRELRFETRGAMRVFDDERTVACALRDGLYCGLQNSVIRRSVFDGVRFQAASRNEAEDQLFVIRSLKRGHRLGYIDAIHVQYHVHESNSSAPDASQSVDRQLKVYRPLVKGFEDLQAEFEWTPLERRELSQRIATDHFWHIGYAVLWNGGRHRDALAAYWQGLKAWPWSFACWKTYLVARLRVASGRAAPGRNAAG
jgi:glycosyltransferase involved in cell wall biosynthesis